MKGALDKHTMSAIIGHARAGHLTLRNDMKGN